MNKEQEYDPLKFAVSIKTEAEYMRLPPTGQHDPIFALKRTFLNSLILPSKENNWRPPVRSIVIRRKRGRKGVRLIDVASLRAYIQDQADAEDTQAVEAAQTQNDSGTRVKGLAAPGAV